MGYNMSRKLILIGGMPGSGKTYVGKKLAGRVGFFVDKDITRLLTEQLLESYGLSKHDCESETYVNQIKDFEYKTVIKIALDNIELGHSVVCCAPFIDEFNDSKWLNNINMEAERFCAEMIKIWIKVDLQTAYKRLVSRNAGQDQWKRTNWEDYIKTNPHILNQDIKENRNTIIIDNSHESNTPVAKQINEILPKIS